MKNQKVICFNCKKIFNKEENLDEGYTTIARCPHCGSANSV